MALKFHFNLSRNHLMFTKDFIEKRKQKKKFNLQHLQANNVLEGDQSTNIQFKKKTKTLISINVDQISKLKK